jgi:hypothetical protein
MNVLVTCVPEDNAVKPGKVDVFILRIIRQGNRIFVLGAHTQLCYLFIFMTILVVRFWQSVCQIVQIFVSSNGLE